MAIIDIEQGTPEWHAWRDAGVTASEIACIFGSSPFKTHWQLWAEKSGLRQPDDIDRNPYVRRGKAYEHMLREHVATKRKLGIVPCCVEWDDDRLLRASLDGIDTRRRPWEFKVPSEGNFEAVRKDRLESLPARTYYLQVQHQILCTGASEGYLVFGRIDESQPLPRVAETIVLPVAPDPEIHQEIVAKARDFHDAVVNGVAPEKDPERDVFAPASEQDASIWRAQADRIVPLLLRKKQLQGEIEKLEKEIKSLSEPVKAILGVNKAGEFAGLRILKVTRTGAVDWPRYAKAKGDDPRDEAIVGPYRKAGTSSYQLKTVE